MAAQEQVYDFVIVGSGGGALCSALVMKSLGKNPVVLEKTEFVGGSTAMSGGVMWIPDNKYTRAAGVHDSAELSQEYLDKLTTQQPPGRGGTEARRRAFVEYGPKMVDFLERQGVELKGEPGYSDYYDNEPGGLANGRAIIAKIFDVNRLGPEWVKKYRLTGIVMPLDIKEFCRIGLVKRTWEGRAVAAKLVWRTIKQKLLGQRLVGTGAALQGRVLEACLKAGIEIRVNSPVTELIVEDGRVTGVVVKGEAGEQRIMGTLGVLVNAGGFSRNQEMRDKYQPGTSVDYTNANPGDTGEMIREMERIGVDIDLLDESWWLTMSRPPGHEGLLPMHLLDFGKPHAMMVDASGQRFCNEAASYMEVGQKQLARTRSGVNANPAWMILDSQHRNNYMLGAAQPGITPKEWIESGYLKKADTLEELARQCGLDPEALKATVARYNGFAATGKDEDFNRGGRVYDTFFGDPSHKPSATLGDISKPPYYALQIYVGDVGTAGGAVTDEFARALTPEGKVVPGLYVTGNSSAPATGRYYVGPGTSIGGGFTFGYIAANHAASLSNSAMAQQNEQSRPVPERQH